MPDTAITVPAKRCGCLRGDDCGCDATYYTVMERGPRGSTQVLGTAYYPGRG